jgi:hypothetical protein
MRTRSEGGYQVIRTTSDEAYNMGLSNRRWTSVKIVVKRGVEGGSFGPGFSESTDHKQQDAQGRAKTGALK